MKGFRSCHGKCSLFEQIDMNIRKESCNIRYYLYHVCFSRIEIITKIIEEKGQVMYKVFGWYLNSQLTTIHDVQCSWPCGFIGLSL